MVRVVTQPMMSPQVSHAVVPPQQVTPPPQVIYNQGNPQGPPSGPTVQLNPNGQVLPVAHPGIPTSPQIGSQIHVQQVINPANHDPIRNRMPFNPTGQFVSRPLVGPSTVVPRSVNPIAMGINQNHVQQMQNWNGTREERMMGQQPTEAPPTNNSRTIIVKWQEDERLGDKATISPVLYANLKHPNLKTEYPDWQQRQKQIQRLWRKITQEERAPFLTQARENRHKLKAVNSKGSSRNRGVSQHQQKTLELKRQNSMPVQGVEAHTGTSGASAVNVSAAGQDRNPAGYSFDLTNAAIPHGAENTPSTSSA